MQKCQCTYCKKDFSIKNAREFLLTEQQKMRSRNGNELLLSEVERALAAGEGLTYEEFHRVRMSIMAERKQRFQQFRKAAEMNFNSRNDAESSVVRQRFCAKRRLASQRQQFGCRFLILVSLSASILVLLRLLQHAA